MKRATTEDNVVKKKKKKGNKHVDPNVLETRRSIQQCCASNNVEKALQLYNDARSQGIQIEVQTFSNLLSLCDGLGERHVHIGTPKPCTTENGESKTDAGNDTKETSSSIPDMTIAERRSHAFEIKQHMDSLDIPLGETAYTALIRLLIKNDELDQALVMLDQAEKQNNMKPKLRLYSSLLVALCSKGDMEKGTTIWIRLSNKFEATEREYLALIQCACINGNSQVMQHLLSEVAEDVLVPSKETIRALVSWFESNHAVENNNGGAVTKQEQLQLPSTDAPVLMNVQSPHGWTISHACRISRDGVLQSGCLQGQSLKPVTLSQETWRKMMDMNETIVLQGMLENDTSAYQGGGKGKKRIISPKLQQQRRQEWKSFQQYCQQAKRHRTPNSSKVWDVVLDGANIGYYQQNFQNAPKHVDYQQIDWVVQHFISKGKRVLLVLHQRHFSPQLLPEWAKPIVQKWSPLLYKTPFGCNDDWFWLHAALYSGINTLVVTNDEMRDHYFQMLSHREFNRFKERHQVRFGFGAWNSNNSAREVMLVYPEPYSRRIQSLQGNDLVVPLTKRGDENRFLDGSHVAQDEPEEERYLCIRPKTL